MTTDNSELSDRHSEQGRERVRSSANAESRSKLRGWVIAGSVPFVVITLIFYILWTGSDGVRGISTLELSFLSIAGMFGGVTVDYSVGIFGGDGNAIGFAGDAFVLIHLIAWIPVFISAYYHSSRYRSKYSSYLRGGVAVSVPFAVLSGLSANLIGTTSFQTVSRQSSGYSLRGGGGVETEVTANVLAQTDPALVIGVSLAYAALIGLVASFAARWRHG